MRFPPFLLLGWLAAAVPVAAAPLALIERSISSSRQIRVYCPDAPMRSQVASFAEDVKESLLGVLGEPDRWKYPVIISLGKMSPAETGQPPAEFLLARVEEGFKVEIDVRIGDNPAQINLQKQLVHALLMEFAYRNSPEAIRAGEKYADIPWWLLEGTLQIFRKRQTGLDADVFKRIISANKLPPLEVLLADRPEKIGGDTALAVDQGCAACLLQLLLDQPSGKQNLARYLQHMPEGNADRVGALVRDFPSLSDRQNLQKWWTLSLARFSATDRYQGMSPEETDAELAALLHLDIPAPKGDEKKAFEVANFDEYLKIPASRDVLVAAHTSVVALSARANALFRPILVDYEQIFSLLARGKTHGVKDRLVKVERYRSAVLKHTSGITDYMNWFEATQLETKSDSFNGFLKLFDELDRRPKRTDPVSLYLDDVAESL